MLKPPVWPEARLESDRKKAIKIFRDERIGEPLEKYLDEFDEQQGRVEELLESLVDIADLKKVTQKTLLEIIGNEALLRALRYLAGPPVSLDDLLVVADVESLSPKVLKERPEVAKAIFETVLLALDKRRFPWVADKREPTESEREAAIVASAALMAAQSAATARRQEGKAQQEAAVFAALEEIKFKRSPARQIEVMTDAPDPGEFCSESMLGSRKADVIVRLRDKRLLAIECKVSNSFTNSIKRLNNDAAVKAGIWLREFGMNQVIPSALLSGVFKLRNLIAAQAPGLTIWWAHDLDSFQDWVKRAR